MSREKEYTLDDAFLSFGERRKMEKRLSPSNLNKLLEKSVFNPGLEKEKQLPINALRKKPAVKKKARPEISQEVINDLRLIKMRSVLDPKRFYKKDKYIGASGNIQVGHVVDSAVDFFSSRLPSKLRKRTLAEELMADSEFKQFSKRKLAEVLTSSKPRGARHRAMARAARKRENKKKRKNAAN